MLACNTSGMLKARWAASKEAPCLASMSGTRRGLLTGLRTSRQASHGIPCLKVVPQGLHQRRQLGAGPAAAHHILQGLPELQRSRWTGMGTGQRQLAASGSSSGRAWRLARGNWLPAGAAVARHRGKTPARGCTRVLGSCREATAWAA